MITPEEFVREYNERHDAQYSSYDCDYNMMLIYAIRVLADYRKQIEEKDTK